MSKKIVERRPFPILTASCDVFDRRGCVQVTPKRYSSKNDLKTKEEKKKRFFWQFSFKWNLRIHFFVNFLSIWQAEKGITEKKHRKYLFEDTEDARPIGGKINQKTPEFFSRQNFIFALVSVCYRQGKLLKQEEKQKDAACVGTRQRPH